MDTSSVRCVVGFIGLGLMGSGLARNAQEKSHPVVLLARSPETRQRLSGLTEAGAATCATASEVAACADVIVICVTGADEVEQVVFSKGGLLDGFRPGTVVVDCSTSLPESSRRIAEAIRARGGEFLDAALTGTPKEAEEGTVNLLIGGKPEVLERIRLVLNSFARNIFHCGDIGAGHTIKLIHQYVVLGNAAILAEAFTLAKKSEVDLEVLCDVIASGGANSTAFQRLRHYILEGDDSFFRFSLANALKDMRYYTRMAEGSQAASPIASCVRSAYTAANDAGYADKFVPHLMDALEGRASEKGE